MKSIYSLIFGLLLSGASLAQSPAWQSERNVAWEWETSPAGMTWHEVQQVIEPVAEAARNVVEVHFPSGGGSSNKGSGVYLGERLVATAYHVPRGTSGNGYVLFRDGTRMNCRTIQTDKVWDQAILEIESEHPSLVGVELATMNPRAGDMLYSSGFGRGFRIFGGKMTGQWASPGGTPTTDWFDHENPAIPGDSGGPVFNEAGQLIGCLWGTDGRHTVGTGTGRFNVFVKPLFPRIAAWRAQRIASQIQGIQPQQGCLPELGGSCYGIPAPRSGGVVTQPGYNPTPVEPPQLPQPSPTLPQCNCDEQAIIETILEQIATDERFRGPAGPTGPQGLAGPAGVDGRDGEVLPSHLAAITESIITTIRSDDRFRGPRGEQGPAGPGTDIDVDALAADIMSRVKFPSQRVLLVDGKRGEVIDDETYAPGEPIVLDFQQILRSANAKR